MRIGDDDNFLLLEARSLEIDYAALRIEAVASGSGRRFTALHDRLLMDADEAVIQRFSEFSSLKTEQFEVALTEKGWLRFRRDSHGAITVRYRIAAYKVSAVLEGEVFVHGEFANKICREFGVFLQKQR